MPVSASIPLPSLIQMISSAPGARSLGEIAAAWLNEQAGPAVLFLYDPLQAVIRVATPAFDVPYELLALETRIHEQRDRVEPYPFADGFVLPLVYENLPYGAIWLQQNALSDVRLIAALLAARLHALATEHRYRSSMEGLHEISLALSGTSDEVWDRLCEQLCSLFDATSLYVGLVDIQRKYLTIPLAASGGVQCHWEAIPLSGLPAAVVTYGTELLFNNLELEADRLQGLRDEPNIYEPGYPARSWIGVPLRSRSREVLGLICLQHDLPEAFDDHDLMLLMTVAAQVALAVENWQLLEAERERRKIASMLIEVGQVVSSTLHYDEVLDRILEQLHRVIDFECGAVLLPVGPHYPGRMVVCAYHGPRELRGAELVFDADNPLVLAYHSQQPIVLDNTAGYSGWPPGALNSGGGAWISAPMVVQDRVIGIITLENAVPGAYTERDASTVFALARYAAIAVENARLHALSQANLHSLQQRSRYQTSLHHITSIITSTLDTKTVLDSAAELLTELFSIDHCAIALADEDDGVLRLEAEYPNHGNVGSILAKSDGPGGWRDFQTALRVTAASLEDAPPIVRTLLDLVGAHSALLVPLSVRDRVAGLLMVSAIGRSSGIADVESDMFMTVAGQVALAINNAELYNEAVAANKLKSQFLATISHELRTPLNAIIGYSDLLLNDVYGELNDRQRDRLFRVSTSGRHLLALIDDVLDLSKIEAGQMALSPAPMHLSDLIPGTLSELKPFADSKGLNLIVERSEAEPGVLGDSGRLRQVLVNLLDNAIKFTHEGEIRLRIAPCTFREGRNTLDLPVPPNEAVADGDWVALSVADTGIGIQRQDHNVIFEAFRQADGSSSRQYGGSGLGLAITRQLVLLHGGHIWVTSEAGKGSTFFVLLPATPESNGNQEIARDHRPLLLVLEQERETLDSITSVLEDTEFQVVGVAGLGQAAELARRLQPTVMAFNAQLADIAPWAVLNTFKSEPELASIPLAAFTARDDTAAFYLTPRKYLTRPLDRQTVLSIPRDLFPEPPAEPVLIVQARDAQNELETWLSRAGYTVAVVASREEALQWLSRQPAAMIWLDLLLADYCGADLLFRLAEDNFTAAIPLVALLPAMDDSTDRQLRESLLYLLQRSRQSGSSLHEQLQMAVHHRHIRERRASH